MSQSAVAATPALEPVLSEFREEAAITRRLLERVPADKLTWKPDPTSNTLGQLALHTASVPGSFAYLLGLEIFEVPPDAFIFKQPENVAEILSTFDTGVPAAEAFIAGLSSEAAQATWTTKFNGRTMMSLPRAKALRMLLMNHSIHHRGQLSVYLRELGVKIPAIYGPSADENPFV